MRWKLKAKLSISLISCLIGHGTVGRTTVTTSLQYSGVQYITIFSVLHNQKYIFQSKKLWQGLAVIKYLLFWHLTDEQLLLQTTAISIVIFLGNNFWLRKDSRSKSQRVATPHRSLENRLFTYESTDWKPRFWFAYQPIRSPFTSECRWNLCLPRHRLFLYMERIEIITLKWHDWQLWAQHLLV